MQPAGLMFVTPELDCAFLQMQEFPHCAESQCVAFVVVKVIQDGFHQVGYYPFSIIGSTRRNALGHTVNLQLLQGTV